MYFRDIIGNEDIIRQLRSYADRDAVPHALLFAGPAGTCKLQTAIAFVRYLLCETPQGGDSCGHCPGCVKTAKLIHPDMHFVFPVINKSKSSTRKTISDDEIDTWRDFLLTEPNPTYDKWLNVLDAGNQQAMIYTDESDSITHKLQLTSNQGGYKTVILWMPEKMHENCANKLLKILEEPPAKTVFILVTDDPIHILGTISSRTQRIDFSYIPEDITAECTDRDSREFLELFIQLMRMAYARKLKEMKQLSEDLASRGREWQKDFLQYCQRMVRENFINNLHQPQLTYMNGNEQEFSSRFSPFVNERNITGITFEIEECQRHIEQNVNAKMVFFDFALKLIMLLKQ